MSDSCEAGAGALVDRDMNAVFTRMSALQVQQQLGGEALGIADVEAGATLKLFA